MQSQINAMRVAIAAIAQQLDALETAFQHTTPIQFPDCVSPVPLGHDTVLGYLAKTQPDLLAFMNYCDPEATQRDGLWLSHRCRERGLPRMSAPVPPCLQHTGIYSVRVYPVDLLARRFPT